MGWVDRFLSEGLLQVGVLSLIAKHAGAEHPLAGKIEQQVIPDSNTAGLITGDLCSPVAM